MSATIKIPLAHCRLALPEGALQLSEPEEAGRKPRFKMQVNSGLPMPDWWEGTLAVNLAGVSWKGKHVAALLDHDVSKRVGYTTKLYVDDEQGLMAEGILLTNEHAEGVRKDSAEGFPWQASCYLAASKVLRLEDGVQHEVNGKTITGPAMVFEASELREVTICALGRDPNTATDASLGDVAETITAQLSVKVSTMTTKNEPTAATPAATPVDTDAVALAARSAETQRVTDIMELASECQFKLAAECIKAGDSAIVAAKKLANDSREREAVASPSTKPTPATAPMAAPEPPPSAAEAEALALAAEPDGLVKWQKEWAASAALQAEFEGNEARWLAYNNNKHRCRDFGSESNFKKGN
jgi:hypothetical protein